MSSKDSCPITTDYKAYYDIKQNIKFVHLTDLHSCVYGNANSVLLNAIAKAAPDAILITGDMFNKRTEDCRDAIDFLHKLPDIAPCFYSFGNHELRYRRNFPKSFENILAGLKSCGICVLDDETTLVQLNGTDVEIGGFSADLSGYRKFKKTRTYEHITEPGTDAKVKLLLAHNPLLLESYKGSGWDIILSGHLHGGIVGLPGGRGLIAPDFSLFPKYSRGFFRVGEKQKLLVSAGLGSHTLHFRLFNPPEIVTLTAGKTDLGTE